MSHPDPKWTYDDLEPPTTYNTDTSITTHIPVELFNEIFVLGYNVVADSIGTMVPFSKLLDSVILIKYKNIIIDRYD